MMAKDGTGRGLHGFSVRNPLNPWLIQNLSWKTVVPVARGVLFISSRRRIPCSLVKRFFIHGRAQFFTKFVRGL